MSTPITVKAIWDSDVNVWVAESPDLPGLVAEASSLNELDAKLPDLIIDLLDIKDTDGRVPTWRLVRSVFS